MSTAGPWPQRDGLRGGTGARGGGEEDDEAEGDEEEEEALAELETMGGCGREGSGARNIALYQYSIFY